MTPKLMKVSWEALGISVLVEPIAENQELFDWFLTNTPVRSLMSHAKVSGCHAYTNNICIRKPMIGEKKWYTIRRDQAPVGTVGLFVGAGSFTTLAMKYGELTETAPYPSVLGNVRASDLGALQTAGQMVWDAVFNTKKIITVEFRGA